MDGVPSIEKMRRYEEGNRLGTSSHSFHSVNDVSEIQKTILVSVVLGTQGKVSWLLQKGAGSLKSNSPNITHNTTQGKPVEVESGVC